MRRRYGGPASAGVLLLPEALDTLTALLLLELGDTARLEAFLGQEGEQGEQQRQGQQAHGQGQGQHGRLDGAAAAAAAGGPGAGGQEAVGGGWKAQVGGVGRRWVCAGRVALWAGGIGCCGVTLVLHHTVEGMRMPGFEGPRGGHKVCCSRLYSACRTPCANCISLTSRLPNHPSLSGRSPADSAFPWMTQTRDALLALPRCNAAAAPPVSTAPFRYLRETRPSSGRWSPLAGV